VRVAWWSYWLISGLVVRDNSRAKRARQQSGITRTTFHIH
jgi:hypothetical protein